MNELVIDEPPKIANMYAGISGISLGSSTLGAAQRIACYEEPTGTYFYGCGLFDTPNVVAGFGIWGGTGAAQPDQTGSSGGVNPHLLVTYTGRVGIGVINPGASLDVSGDADFTGTVTAATKQFVIDHPDPVKNGQKLRHWCIEGDDVGGACMYRRQLECSRGNNTLQMPGWFQHLCTDVLCFTSPAGHHFGLSWAAQNDDDPGKITVGVSRDGLYNVLVTARRKDMCATQKCPQEVEFTPQLTPAPTDETSNAFLPP